MLPTVIEEIIMEYKKQMEKAEKVEANAIVGMQFSTSVVMGNAAEMMAYGTAVIVEDN